MKWSFVLLCLTFRAFADDAADARFFAEAQRQSALQTMQRMNPADYLDSYNPNPPQQNIAPENLEALGQQQVKTDPLSQSLIEQEHERAQQKPLDMNTGSMREAGDAIQNAEPVVNGQSIPCHEGYCMPTADEDSSDFSEGVSELGVLTEEANGAIRIKKNKRSMNITVFSGTNNTCRVAVAGIGNCCGGHARLLNCRPLEKELANAIVDNRAYKVGRYCAHKVLTCLETKESWCVFPSKIASVFQIQGRLKQLGIGFGWAEGEDNEANCRGLTPAELQKIRIDQLDLSSVSQEFERKVKPKGSAEIESKARSRIDEMQKVPHD
jgi:hypothetical protein